MKKVSLREGVKKLTAIPTRNLGLKLISVICALCLWSYVIATNPDITQDKVLSGVSITVTGQSVLEESRGLALLTNMADVGEVRVRVRVPQSGYHRVTSDNVRVELDLSSIRQSGTQSVKLQGTSSYGTILDIIPSYIDLQVESRDQRYVPVNVVITGEKAEGFWYGVSRVNPSQVRVTGPASQVQTVSSARINLDLTDRTKSHSSVENLMLMDAQGQEVAGNLSMSSSSVTVTMDVYPKKILPVSQDIQELLTGQIVEGYQVDGVEISPAQLEVAADAALLDSLEEINVEPVSVTGARRSFTTIARVRTLKGIRNLSSEDVSVTVNLSEQELTRRFSNIALQVLGEPKGVRCEVQSNRVTVRVDGPYSDVRALNREDIQAVLDLSGLEKGTYMLPVRVEVDNYPELTAIAVPEQISVQIGNDKTTGVDVE